MAFHPKLPEELTPNYWNNHKGNLAKLQGGTGVSAALRAVINAYGNIDWDHFDPDKVNGKGKPLWLATVKQRAEAQVPNCVALARALDTAATAADRTAAQFKAAKTVPDSAVKVAHGIAVKARSFATSVEKDTVTGYITRTLKACKEEVDKLAGVLRAGLKTTAAANEAAMKTMQAAVKQIIQLPTGPARAAAVNTVGQGLSSASRDYTQLLNNMAAFAQSGYDFGAPAAKFTEMGNKLVAWGNAGGGSAFNGDEDDKALAAALLQFSGIHAWCKTVA